MGKPQTASKSKGKGKGKGSSGSKKKATAPSPAAPEFAPHERLVLPLPLSSDPNSFSQRAATVLREALEEYSGRGPVDAAPAADQGRFVRFPWSSAQTPLSEIPLAKRSRRNEQPPPRFSMLERAGTLMAEGHGSRLDQAESDASLRNLARIATMVRHVTVGRRSQTVLPVQRRFLQRLGQLAESYEAELANELARARRVRLFFALVQAYARVVRLDREGRSAAEQRDDVRWFVFEAIKDCYPAEDERQLSARTEPLVLDAASVRAVDPAAPNSFRAALVMVAKHLAPANPTQVFNEAKTTSGIEVAAIFEEASGNDGWDQMLQIRLLEVFLGQP